MLHKLKFIFNENTAKNTAWFIFLVISCLVIANLFIRMVDDPVLKFIFVVIAIGLDLFRQYVVSKAKQYWRTNKGQSAALWLVYLVHFSIVIIASAGFTMSEVNAKSQTAGIYNGEKQSILDTIHSNESEIKKLESLRETLDPSKWQFREASSRIDALQKANSEHYLRLADFKEVKVNIKDDVFGSIGKAFHIPGECLQLYVFIVIAILIELALLITSRDIKAEPGSEREPGPEREPCREPEIIKPVFEAESKPGPSREPEPEKKDETFIDPIIKAYFDTGMKTPVTAIKPIISIQPVTAIKPIVSIQPETLAILKENGRFETQAETQAEMEKNGKTVKNGKKICPCCGKHFSFKHDDKTFCGSKCRLAAYRNKSAIGGPA